MGYALIHWLHVTTVVTTLVLFVGRAVWLLRHAGAGYPRPRWLRWLPHVNDSLLLTFGIWLAVLLDLNPLHQPWLLAKLVALLLYIWLGLWALKWATTRRARLLSLLLALTVFGYIVGTALTRQPAWPLAGFVALATS